MLKKKLKKNLKLWDIVAIATGTTLSGGFFLLPGLAATIAGPALILAYVLAAVILIPSLLSNIELSTAMPKAGGIYYFLDRTLGPFMGTVGGIGTWLVLIFKVAFALVGMGAYIKLFFPELPIIPVAVILAIILGLLNLLSSKKSGNFQIILVVGLMGILTLFIAGGVPKINFSNFNNFFGSGFDSIIATSGMVFISFSGVIKVVSLSEEVENPERNLPLGLFISMGVAVLIYILGTSVMVGLVPMNELSGNLTPVAEAANNILGSIGVIAVSIAALLAFVSVANAGTMSASRYPLAMSRDHILPPVYQKLSKQGIPYIGVFLTVALIITVIVFLDPLKIAKLASAFQLTMFGIVCIGVIVMRESKIESYDPSYKSPLYPWLQIIGFIASVYLIFEMGTLPIIFSSGLVILGLVWYLYYVRKRVIRTGAIYHIFERLGKFRYVGLDRELRGILKEKGLRAEDPYDDIVARSKVYDLGTPDRFENIVNEVSTWIADHVPFTASEIAKQFLEGTRIGATPVTHGMALPHLRIKGLENPLLAMVRSKEGIKIKFNNPLNDNDYDEEEIVNAIFFLVSPEQDPTQHLRILAQIAGRVENDSFTKEWQEAKTEEELREALLHDDRYIKIKVEKETSSKVLIGKAIREINLPEGCLITWLRRGDQMIVPKGNTILELGDIFTIIGEPESMKQVKKRFKEY